MNKPSKKVFSPLVIDLVNQKLVKTSDNDLEYDLNIGLMNGRENYGFILISKGEKIDAVTFGTEERIDALEIKNNNLYIYEDGKYFPWKFSLDGNLLQESNYSMNSLSNQEICKKIYENFEETTKSR